MDTCVVYDFCRFCNACGTLDGEFKEFDTQPAASLLSITNDMFPNTTSGTVIRGGGGGGGFACGGGDNRMMSRVQEQHIWSQGCHKERKMMKSFRDLVNGAGSGNVVIPSTVIEDAKAMFVRVGGKCRGKSATMLAACVYYACQSNDVPKRWQEVVGMFCEEDSHAFTRCYKMLSHMELESTMATPPPAETTTSTSASTTTSTSASTSTTTTTNTSTTTTTTTTTTTHPGARARVSKEHTNSCAPAKTPHSMSPQHMLNRIASALDTRADVVSKAQVLLRSAQASAKFNCTPNTLACACLCFFHMRDHDGDLADCGKKKKDGVKRICDVAGVSVVTVTKYVKKIEALKLVT